MKNITIKTDDKIKNDEYFTMIDKIDRNKVTFVCATKDRDKLKKLLIKDADKLR